MDHIDNEYNKRFNNKKLPNDEFDTEGLWNGIAKGLEKKQHGNFGFIYRNRWMVGIALLIIFMGTCGVIQIINVGQGSSKEISILNANHSLTNDENKTKPVSPVLGKTKQPNFQDGNSDESPTTGTTSKINSITKESSKQNIESGNLSKQIFPSKNAQQLKLPKNLVLKEITPSSAITKQSNITKVSSSNTIDRTLINELPQLSARHFLIKLNRSHDLTLALSGNYKMPKTTVWKLGIMGGSNISKYNFNSNANSELAALKEKTEKGQWGKSFGINAGVLWKNRWLVSSGIQYHQLWSKFEYNQQENISVSKENQLLKIWIDAGSGDTLSRSYGDTLVNAVLTRDVVHFNKFQQIRIPIEFGIQKNTNKIIYGLSVGAVFNFTTTQSGKTFDENAEIVVFDKNDSVAPFKAFNIGLGISPIFGYQVLENWDISFRPQWMWQLNTNFDLPNFNTCVHLFYMNVGVGYSF